MCRHEYEALICALLTEQRSRQRTPVVIVLSILHLSPSLLSASFVHDKKELCGKFEPCQTYSTHSTFFSLHTES